DPIDASQQCCLVHARSWRQGKLEDDLRLYSWLSETHERERTTDLGEVVYRAAVNISPDRSIFGPNRAIREADFASHRHLAAPLPHLPYCGSHAVSIVEIERRKARREWRDLAAGIEGGRRFRSDGLQFSQGVCIAVVITTIYRLAKNSMSRSFTSFGRSCWIQCPAPGNTTF